MDFGVTITAGALPWQIFQQTDGAADITVSGRYKRVRLSQELPLQFTELEGKPVTVKARIAWEESGESVIPWQLCELREGDSWTVTLRSVPAGGLYRIETYMEYEGWDGLSCTRGDMVHFIGVGDIWVIAGQSNAAGRAKNPVCDSPEPGVSMLRSSGKWDMASHPLNETTGAVHVGHFENHNPGHSPWLHFAKQLKKRLGYPIGLVNCAYGGAPLRWWNPEENGSLFQNMLEMLGEHQIAPKGMLWSQGEAEGYENSADTYFERLSRFLFRLRKEFPGLPFVLVQTNRCVLPAVLELDRSWGMVREAQRRAMHELEGVYTVPSNDVALYDFIHNASEGNLVIGERCAKAALAEVYGKSDDWRAPEAVRAVRRDASTVSVELSPLKNWINPFDVGADRLPFTAEDDAGLVNVKEYKQEDPFLILTFERPLLENARLHGCWRADSGTAVLDCMRMPMLSFYGLKIEQEKGS